MRNRLKCFAILACGSLASLNVSQWRRRCHAEQGAVFVSSPWKPDWDGHEKSGEHDKYIVFISSFSSDPQAEKKQVRAVFDRLKQLKFHMPQMLASSPENNKAVSKLASMMNIDDEERFFVLNGLSDGIHFTPDPLPVEIPQLPSNAFMRWKKQQLEEIYSTYMSRNTEGEGSLNQLYVCDASVISYFVCKLLQFPLNAWSRLNLKRASLTCLRIAPDGQVELLNFNDTRHLEYKYRIDIPHCKSKQLRA